MTKFTFATDKVGFDKHIELSIRGYLDLWDDIVKFSRFFVEDGTTIVDIGCSTGTMLKKIKKYNDDQAPNCVYRGIEIEEDFFPELDDADNLQFDKIDVIDFDWSSTTLNCSFITSIFTLQFIPKRNRKEIIEHIYNALIPGGAFILAEKILSIDPQLEEMMTFCYYDWKKQHFSEKEILEKESQLRHMMKLRNHVQLMEMLRDAGFTMVQQFWQNFNFIACIAIKNDS